MVNEIITAIAQRLDESFDGTEVHIDKLPQGFEEPCFFIRTLHCSQKQIIGERYYWMHGFDVHYFPGEHHCKTAREINEVGDRLWMVLEYIELADGPIRGTEMRYEPQGDVLHFFVNYDVFALKKRDRGPYMQELTQKQRIKE